MSRKSTAPSEGAPDEQLLTDAQGKDLLNLGMTRFLELQKTDPDFPPPIWLGPRGKRHARSLLLRYAMGKRQRVPA